MAGGGAEAVWEADVETNLFRALIKHKPVGTSGAGDMRR